MNEPGNSNRSEGIHALENVCSRGLIIAASLADAQPEREGVGAVVSDA